MENLKLMLNDIDLAIEYHNQAILKKSKELNFKRQIIVDLINNSISDINGKKIICKNIKDDGLIFFIMTDPYVCIHSSFDLQECIDYIIFEGKI